MGGDTPAGHSLKPSPLSFEEEMMASAELSSLFHLLSNSLSTQEAVRKEAESQLEQASSAPGFSGFLLQVAVLETAELAVKQAAAVYFKNLINKRYDPYDESKVTALSDADKAQIRGLIVSAVVGCAAVVRPQLVAAAHKVIRADFPKRWPGLVEELYPLITSGNAERVIPSLAIFHEVVSWQGGNAAEETRTLIHGRVFPVLLELLQTHSKTAAQGEKESMTIVKSVLKSFYAAIQYRFSEHLLLGDSFSSWCTAITQILQAPPPAGILTLSREEAEAHLYWKMKKWGIRIHNKIFQRYGCSKLDSYNNPEHGSFAKLYMQAVAVPILNTYLSQIQENLQGRNPYNERIFCLINDFLEGAIRHKTTWAVLEGHLMNLVAHYLFPQICFQDEDAEMWEEDQEEYVRVKLDPFDEIYSRPSSSVNFIVDLIKNRKKATFVSILQFINGTLSAPVTDQTSARRKDGALFLLGSIARLLISSEFKGQVEAALRSFVIPELTSTYGFLRMRACWAIEQYDDVEYPPQTCLECLEKVLNCLTDKELPVKVAAAGALGALLDNETSQKTLPPYLGRVMESMLSLANEIQLDSIAFVLERLVQMFSDDLAPYAVQLCIQLRDTVARNLEGYKNVLDVDLDDEAFGQGTDKMMAVVGMLKTIETLIESMSKTPEMLPALEEAVMPLLAMILERRVVDVYEEVFEMIDSITYTRKEVSPSLWNLLPFIYRAFQDVGSDYIQDMQTTLDNIISYGAPQVLAKQEYLGMFVEIIKCTMTRDEFNEHDRVYGCKLMESLMLNCRGGIDGLIGTFIEYVVPGLRQFVEDGAKLEVVVSHLETIINAIYYNPVLALSHLERLEITGPFFQLWFSKASKFTRVHDKRLIIMSLSALFASVPHDQLPSVIRENWAHILPLYLHAVQTLPKALEERKRLEEEDDDLSDSDFESEDLDDADDDGDDETEEAEAIYQATNPRLGAFDEEAYEDDEDDEADAFEEELEEEPFFETPLDKLDMASVVQQSLRGLAHSQPASFGLLTKDLSQDQSVFLHSLLN